MDEGLTETGDIKDEYIKLAFMILVVYLMLYVDLEKLSLKMIFGNSLQK